MYYEFDDEENNTSNKKVIRIPVSFNSFGIISICVISWYSLLSRKSIRVYMEQAVIESFFFKTGFPPYDLKLGRDFALSLCVEAKKCAKKCNARFE